MSSKRTLLPREHGAYAQLLVPIATALLLRTPTWPSVLFAVAACAAFVANEPLLVVLGHRGRRAYDLDGQRARRRLASMVAIALVAGGLALLLSTHAAAVAAVAAAIPSLFLIALAWRRAERTLGGELVAAIALSGASVPVMAAAGFSLSTAMWLWLSWSGGFAATVVAVHRMIARHRRRESWLDRVAAVGLEIISGIAIVCGSAMAPLLVVSTALVVAPPPATYLRKVGVLLLAGSLLSAVLLVATTWRQLRASSSSSTVMSSSTFTGLVR